MLQYEYENKRWNGKKNAPECGNFFQTYDMRLLRCEIAYHIIMIMHTFGRICNTLAYI